MAQEKEKEVLISRSDLREWLKEDWVRVSDPSKPCGRSDADKGKYPKCRPKASVKQMTKSERESAVKRKRKAEKTKKRKGKKPINVSTYPKKKKKSNLEMLNTLTTIYIKASI